MLSSTQENCIETGLYQWIVRNKFYNVSVQNIYRYTILGNNTASAFHYPIKIKINIFHVVFYKQLNAHRMLLCSFDETRDTPYDGRIYIRFVQRI